MKDATARAISTSAVWLSVALVLAVGVFQRNWTGDAALMLLGLVVIVLCGSAAGATVAIWRGANAHAVREAADPSVPPDPGRT